MKRQSNLFSIALVLLVLSSVSLYGQKKKSPHASASNMVADLKIEIDYHQPGVYGRKIWGDLVPFDKVWRTGANNATTFEVNKDVKVNGQTLKAGKYAMFTIPTEDSWTIIFNSESDQWGSYNYDASKDVLKFEVKPSMEDELVERMRFDVTEKGEVKFAWENLRFSFKVKG